MLEIVLWNCNGLHEDKFTDIELQYFSGKRNNTIVMLTETHHYGKILNLKEDIVGYGAFRDKKKVDKKEERQGGGIQILMPRNEKLKFKKTKNKNSELLDIEGKMYGVEVRIVVAYFDVRRDDEGKNRNKKLRKDIENIIEKNEKDGLIIAGDFNGHLRMLDGKEDDENGKMLLEWVGNYQLIMLNTDQRCEGRHTRVHRNQKTTLDYIMVNRKIYDLVEEIKIDENKEIMDRSDHVVMSFKIKKNISNNGFKKAKWKVKEYYSQKNEEIEALAEYIEGKWSTEKPRNHQGVINDLKDATDTKLKKKIRIREGNEKGLRIIENPWITEEIRQGIKKRREINRVKRNLRSEERIKIWERRYVNQKIKVQNMVRDAKSKHEIKITNEIKRDKSGKKKWEHINMLTGRKQKAGKDTELYDEQGRKLEIQEGRQKIRETWGDIYKTEVLNITPIDSKAWDVGDIEKTKEEYRERRDRERIEKGKVWIESERPRYTEETLDKGLIKLKKGKSAGLDNIKAETYHAIGKK